MLSVVETGQGCIEDPVKLAEQFQQDPVASAHSPLDAVQIERLGANQPSSQQGEIHHLLSLFLALEDTQMVFDVDKFDKRKIAKRSCTERC